MGLAWLLFPPVAIAGFAEGARASGHELLVAVARFTWSLLPLELFVYAEHERDAESPDEGEDNEAES